MKQLDRLAMIPTPARRNPQLAVSVILGVARTVSVWVLRSLLAALFAIQGILKLAGSPGWISRFREWGYPDNFYLVVGVAELVGAIVLLVPPLSRFGAALLIAVMVGASATHVIYREPQIITTLVLTALLSLLVHLGRR